MTFRTGRFSPFLQTKSESNKLSPFMFASGYAKTYPQQKLLPTGYPVGNSVSTEIVWLPTIPCLQKEQTNYSHYQDVVPVLKE